MPSKATIIEFGRRPNETDEQWAAACKDMARALAKATGMEHLLPDDPQSKDREQGNA